jgi:hypothetical protein
MMGGNRGGVTIPQTQMSQDTTEPNRLLSVLDCEMIAIMYSDQTGRVHKTVVLRAGDEYYMPPGSEQWTNGVKPLHKWLSDALNAQRSTRSDNVPSTDSVDIIADGMKTG